MFGTDSVNLIEWFNEHHYRIDFTKIPKDLKERYGFKNIDIDYFPSSTTILGVAPKPFLAKWRGQVGNWEADRVLEESQNKGSRIHNATSIWMNGGKIIYNNPKRPSFNEQQLSEIINNKPYLILKEQQEQLEVWRFVQWCKAVNPKFIANELMVFSLQYSYAGTLDNIFDIQGGKFEINGTKPIEIPTGRYIIDLKTGGEDDKGHSKQLASYMTAYEEDREKDIDGGIIIYTNAQTKGKIEGLKTVLYSREQLEEQFQKFLNIKKVWDEYGMEKPKIFELPAILSLEDL